jgi:hypothetical protein
LSRKLPRTAFKPGQSGNPAGKPKGSKHKLSEVFLAAVAEDFEQFGIGAIAIARKKDPVAYIKVIASLVPKEHLVQHTLIEQIQSLDDDQLRQRITELERVAGVVSPETRSSTTH